MVIKGAKIQYGVSGSLVTELGTFQLQSRDHTKKCDKDETRDGGGNVASTVWYNETSEATFTYVPKGSGTGGNLSISLPAIGDTMTVTDGNGYDPITGSWYLDEISTQGSNTGALRVTAKLIKYALF